jgi:hypothetical protein
VLRRTWQRRRERAKETNRSIAILYSRSMGQRKRNTQPKARGWRIERAQAYETDSYETEVSISTTGQAGGRCCGDGSVSARNGKATPTITSRNTFTKLLLKDVHIFFAHDIHARNFKSWRSPARTSTIRALLQFTFVYTLQSFIA